MSTKLDLASIRVEAKTEAQNNKYTWIAPGVVIALLNLIEKQKADLSTFGKDTEATENRIIDAEFAAQSCRSKLEGINAALKARGLFAFEHVDGSYTINDR